MNKLILRGENNAAISMNAIFFLKVDLDALGGAEYFGTRSR